MGIAALEEVVMDSAKAKAVVDASKTSMGMDISQVDFEHRHVCQSGGSLSRVPEGIGQVFARQNGKRGSKLAALIGDTVGARLISHAGSLTNLSKYPASTVQILGAEKALFRALKTKGNTPKYGLIFHSTFIGRAAAKNKGRISRYLANKCSLASRIDCFSQTATNVYGEKMKDQVEERLLFLSDGTTPRRNLDVMQEAAAEVAAQMAKKAKKKKKKKEAEVEEEEEAPSPKKKRKAVEEVEEEP